MDGAWFKVRDSRLSPGLFGQSAVEHKGSIYVFGGCDRLGAFYNTLHCWNTKESSWSLLETSGTQPGPRNFHSAVIVKNYMFIHGGKSNGYHSDMYRYHITKRKWSAVTYKDKAPLARYGHALLYNNGSLYIVGGYDQHGFCCDDLYQFSYETHTWRKIQFISPLGAITIGRFHSGVCVYKNKILIYAGKGADAVRNDLLEYDLDNHTWKRIITAKGSPAEPTGRWGHSCNVIGDLLLVFGGRDAIVQYNDLYAFDLTTLKWTLLLPNQKGDQLASMVPEPRYFHAGVAYNNTLLIIWGKNIYDFNFDDIIEWRFKSASSDNSQATPTLTTSGNILNSSNVSSTAVSPPPTSPQDIRSSNKSQGSDSSFSMTIGSQGAQGSTGNRLSGEKRMRLKCVFRDEMRMISVAPVITYQELMDKLGTEYGEKELKIQYEDDEGDLITIRSAADVEEAFVFFGDSHRPSVKLLLSTATSSSLPPSTPSTISSKSQSKSNRHSAAMSPVSALYQQVQSPAQQKVQSSSPRRSNSPPGGPAISASPSQSHLRSPISNRIIKWQAGGIIGEGGFGKVYLGMNSETGELMAVKQVPLSGAESPQRVEALRREIALMQDLHHPNIVRYFGSEAKDGFLNIFLEYQAGGSIATLLTKFHHLSERIIRSFTKQTLQGLEYLHSQGIAHRDIKGANLLVGLYGGIKLADFGASKQLSDLRSYNEGFKTVTGSPYWMAPEVIQGNAGGRSYGRKADIWSLGAAVVEMATGKPPFHHLAPVTALFRLGSSSALPDIPQNLPPVAKDFLGLCFQRDVSVRPTAAELLEHPWMTMSDDSPNHTISGTFDTKNFAFEQDADELPKVHVIEAPVPVAMPKNPKTSTKKLSTPRGTSDAMDSGSTSDSDKQGSGKSKKKSPSRTTASEEPTPASSTVVIHSGTYANATNISPRGDLSESEDDFGSIIDFVSSRLHD